MDFKINKTNFKIIDLVGEYVILNSYLTNENLIYKYSGCIQFKKQFENIDLSILKKSDIQQKLF